MSFRLNKVPRKFLSPENWAPRILLPLSLFIGMGFSLFAGFTPAAARFGTVELEQAEALLDSWDCKTAWNIAWELAKTGNQEARYFLYLSLTRRMIPPAVTSEHTWHYRHGLVLSAYAALTPPEQLQPGNSPDHRAARHDIVFFISRLGLGPNGERVAQCYAGGLSPKTCLDLAVSLGVIPKFEDYARLTEEAARETGTVARCL